MGLIDLKTDLKSLKYGRDKAGGGSSGQPFVQKPLPTSLSQTGNTGGFDSLVRGGTLTIGKTADDVSRLSQLLLSTKTLQGPLFTAKQNTLSKQSVKTQTFLDPNQGTYLPTDTLAQVALTPIGAHNTLFSNPITYSDVVKNDQGIGQNRLVQFYDLKIDTKTGDPTLYSYLGGPGSTAGFGNTNIKLASDRTGVNNPKNQKYKDQLYLTEGVLYQGGEIPPTDFREEIPAVKKQAYKVSLFNRVKTYKTGDPGSKTINRDTDLNTLDRTRIVGRDSINFRPVLSADKFTKQQEEEDLVPFYITLIKYNGQNQVMQFRAYVKGLSDSYTGEWNAQRFAGRGENFYTYGGFNREISLSFTVHAQTKAELLNNYDKLNYLASTLAPDYGKGFMRGNFLRLTYGDYIRDIPGVLKGINFSIPDNSPWDIGRNADGSRTTGDLKDRLPHLIEVTNFNFAPIHDFVPQLDSPFIYAANQENINSYRKEVDPINTTQQEQAIRDRDRRANTEVGNLLTQDQITGGAIELGI